MSRVPPQLAPLLKPYTDLLHNTISPGLSTLTWHSMALERYFTLIRERIADLEMLLVKIADIVDCRIDRNLRALFKVPQLH